LENDHLNAEAVLLHLVVAGSLVGQGHGVRWVVV
jgi:hypothetical protein